MFVDTQGFFLFVQQFLEDLTLVIRMSLPPGQRHQMPADFSHFVPRLRQRVLQPDAPLAAFLAAEERWFNEIKSLRDDILHRTAFGRNRAARFPDLLGVLSAGGGKPDFVGGADLRSYVGGVLVRVFALGCLADEFVRTAIATQHPNAPIPLRSGILVAAGELDLTANDAIAKFELGTVIATVDREAHSAFEYFLRAGEAGGDP